MDVYDRVAPSWIRKKALKRAYELVRMEDENTSFQTIGPVSKAMNMVYVPFYSLYRLEIGTEEEGKYRCRWLEEGPESDAFKNHVAKIRDFSKSTITPNSIVK